MKYQYTDGFETVDKKEAFEAYKNGEYVRIGYQNKDDGAFWSFEQLESNIKGKTDKERFDSVYNHMKNFIIPHTRIKFAIKTK